MHVSIMACSALLLVGTDLGGSAGSDPGATVWAMLDALQQRSASGYVAWMADDFVFESDDPDFRVTCPMGMSKDAEGRFAAHLFHGGATRPDGTPLPTATQVTVSAGPMASGAGGGGAERATVRLDHLRIHIDLADGTAIDLGGTRNDIDLVLTEAGWRLSHWSERHASPAARDSLPLRLAEASRVGVATEAAAAPAHLELALRPDRVRAALAFDVGLPHTGGVLELFDVQGRRVARRDLNGMGAGRYRIALDAALLGSGIYWARIRQGDASLTARCVWER